MRRLHAVAATALVMLASATHAEELSLTDQRFDVSIRSQDVRVVLAELSAAISIPIVLSDAVGGRVDASFKGASASELLDRIAAERALDWRFDGRRVEVTALSEQTTRILDLDGVKKSTLKAALTELGVFQSRYPITAVDGEFAMIVAPPNYVAIVEVVLGAHVKRRAEALAESDKARTLSEQQMLEQARAEATLIVERQRAEFERIEAERRARESQAKRGPAIVRNGVWGG